MIEAAVEVDVVEVDLDDVAVVEEDLDGDQYKHLAHAEVEVVADVSLSLKTTPSSPSARVQLKADGLLTVTMKEAKEERVEKEANHNTRIDSHLKTTSQQVFSSYFWFSILPIAMPTKSSTSLTSLYFYGLNPTQLDIGFLKDHLYVSSMSSTESCE